MSYSTKIANPYLTFWNREMYESPIEAGIARISGVLQQIKY
jgi:hypothetical protein